jgi:hypothetical protein
MAIRVSRLAAVLAGVLAVASFGGGLTMSADPAPVAAPAAASSPEKLLAGLRLTDLAGQPLNITRESKIGTVVIFLSTECPICNTAVPEINRLAKIAADKKLAFFGVISDANTTRAQAIKHHKEFKQEFTEIFDASGELAAALKPTTTPHAFVLSPEGKILYSGRIDDSYSAVTRQAGVTKSRDLEDAILAVAAGKAPAVAETKPVGCIFEGWAKKDAYKPTYTRDIAPMMSANCVSCHRDGEVAPFPLTAYKDVSKRAKMLALTTEAKIMPPWKSSDPLGTFRDERHMTAAQIALLKSWADAGTPEGDAANLPEPVKFAGDWELGKPDMIIKMPKPFDVPAGGRDIIRYFVLPIENADAKDVVAFEYHPGNRKVVHHMIAFLDSTGQARKIAKDKGDGTSYASFGGPGFVPTGSLGGWAPGSQPHFLPDESGRRIQKNSDLVMQLHYHPSGKDEKDQGEIGLYFAKTPIKRLAIDFPIANRQIDIPAGEADYVRTAQIPVLFNVTLFGIMPHMHNVGKTMKVWATFPDGRTQTLIDVRDWDWNWQEQYQFREPVKIPLGSRINLEAHYDNSDKNDKNPNNPPKRIRFGEQTTDEMCLCFMQITVDGALGETLLKLGGTPRQIRAQQQNQP